MQDNDNRYVAAFELKGKDVTRTIKEIKTEEVESNKGGKKRKIIIYFEGAKKPFLSVTTNNKTIAGMYGPDVSGWIGKSITLYPTTCPAFGEITDCIRVRPVIPAAVAAVAE